MKNLGDFLAVKLYTGCLSTISTNPLDLHIIPRVLLPYFISSAFPKGQFSGFIIQATIFLPKYVLFPAFPCSYTGHFSIHSSPCFHLKIFVFYG